ncbi:hypothetical protein [Streptomyces sp. NPDC004324]
MTRRARTLARLHTATALLIGFVTLQTWGAVPLWVSVVGAAAALSPIPVALHRASRQVDQHLAEVAARPSADVDTARADAERRLLDRLNRERRNSA